MALGTGTKIIVAKFAGKCHCGHGITKGEKIAWDPKTKATAHEDCHGKVLVEIGHVAGTAAEAAKGVGEMGVNWYYEDEHDAAMDAEEGTPGARGVWVS